MFPPTPADNDTHQEGDLNFRFNLARNTWLLVDQSGAGATDLTFANRTATTGTVTSSTGTDATIQSATATLAGLMSAADFNKLDGVEAGATADQVAADVPVTPSGNLTSTEVQAALTELQNDIDNLSASNAAENYFVTNASPLPGEGEDGDYHLNVTTGDVTGPKSGGAWPADGNAGNNFSQLALADAVLVDTVTGSGGSAATAARSDHAHGSSVGSALPVHGAGSPQIHFLRGDAVLPDGEYAQIDNGQWKQIG